MPGARITLTLPAKVHRRSGNATAALVDPELEQSRHARDNQAAERRHDVPHDAAAGNVRDESPGNRETGANRRDDVADPVDEVEKRAFRLSTGLTLDGDVRLRRRAEVLGQQDSVCACEKKENGGQQQRSRTPVPQKFVHRGVPPRSEMGSCGSMNLGGRIMRERRFQKRVGGIRLPDASDGLLDVPFFDGQQCRRLFGSPG